MKRFGPLIDHLCFKPSNSFPSVAYKPVRTPSLVHYCTGSDNRFSLEKFAVDSFHKIRCNIQFLNNGMMMGKTRCFHSCTWNLIQEQSSNSDNNQSNNHGNCGNRDNVIRRKFVDFQNVELRQSYNSYIDDCCHSLDILTEKEENFSEAKNLVNDLIRMNPYNAYLYIKRADLLVNENIVYGNRTSIMKDPSTVPFMPGNNNVFKNILNDLEMSKKLCAKFSSPEMEAEREYLYSFVYAYSPKHRDLLKALKHIGKAVESSLLNAIFLIQKARIHILLNTQTDIKLGLHLLEQSIFIEPKLKSVRWDSVRYRFLIELNASLKNNKAAHAWCNKAIHRGINPALFYAIKAKLYYDEEKYISHYNQEKHDLIHLYTEKSLDRGRIHDMTLSSYRSLWKSRHLCEKGQFLEALKEIDSAIYSNPDMGALYCFRAYLYHMFHMNNEALEDCKISYGFPVEEKWQIQRCLITIRCCAKMNKPEIAEFAIERDSFNDQMRKFYHEEMFYEFNISDIERANNHRVAGNFEQALQIFDRLVKMYPDSALALFLRGITYLNMNKVDLGARDIKSSFQMLDIDVNSARNINKDLTLHKLVFPHLHQISKL